jgi:hypothetical protein
MGTLETRAYPVNRPAIAQRPSSARDDAKSAPESPCPHYENTIPS